MLNSQSQQLMGPKRVLETVRIAAYFPKRLHKNLIQMANIPSSVDKILHDQVPTVRYGVLAFLLLGIVRIYSKKVEYLCEECDDVLVKLNELSIKKKTNTIDEDISACSPSISRPNSFQLDAFDLQISEERVCSHVRPSEDLMLEDTTRKDAWESHHSVDKNYSPVDGFNSGTFSAAFTPFSDVLSLQFKENEIISTSTCTISTIENLRENYSFFLDETLDPIILGELDKEQTGVPNVEEYVEVEEGPSSATAFDDDHEMDDTVERIMSPQSFIDRQNSILIDETPMFKDPEDPIASSNGEYVEKYTRDSEGPSSVADTDIVKKLNFPVIVTPECINDRPASVNVSQTPILRGTSASGLPKRSLPVKRAADGEHVITHSVEQQQMTPNHNISPHALLFGETHAVQQQASGLALNKKMVQSTSVSGGLTSKFMTIQTPATTESGTFSRKRKCLVDEKCVLDSSAIEENLANTGDLIRLRKKVPHAPLHVWKIKKISNLPGSLVEPLMPYSSALGSVFSVENIEKVQVRGATETREKQNILGSPVIEQSLDREGNLLEAPSYHITPDIAPSTPVAFTSSSKFDDVPSDSQEEESNENAEFDNEGIISSAGDSWEMDKWSVKTREAARCLCKKFLEQRKHKENEEVKLSEMLKGKRKGESANLFYELLVLKSGGYVDVTQHAPFDDISIAGTYKMKNY